MYEKHEIYGWQMKEKREALAKPQPYKVGQGWISSTVRESAFGLSVTYGVESWASMIII